MIRTMSYIAGENFSETMQQAFSYLYNYAIIVESFDQDLNFYDNYLSKIKELEDLIYNYLNEETHENWMVIKYNADFTSILKFLKNEKTKLQKIYKSDNDAVYFILKAKLDDM